MTQNFNLGAYGDPGGAVSLGGYRNRLINGNFDVWQRGTNFSFNNQGGYSADRWVSFANGTAGTGQIDVSRQLFPLPGYSAGEYDTEAYLRQTMTTLPSGCTYMTLSQRIEAFRQLGGQTVTVSFFIRGSAGAVGKAVAAFIQQTYGSGGSAMTSSNSNWTVLTSAFQKVTFQCNIPSNVGKTIGLGAYQEFVIVMSNPAAGDFIDVSQVQIELGSQVSGFEVRPFGVELALCQRYYEVGQDGFSAYQSAGVAIGYYHGFKVPKRAAPTMVVTVAPAGTSNCTGVSAGVIGTDSFYAYGVATATGTSFFTASWKADAEL